MFLSTPQGGINSASFQTPGSFEARRASTSGGHLGILRTIHDCKCVAEINNFITYKSIKNDYHYQHNKTR